MKFAVMCLLLAISAWARATDMSIEVVGLFKDAAVVEIDGKRELLRRGQLSPHGILLLHADSRSAVIEINGRRMKVTLSSRIGTRFQPLESATVTIPLNHQGQYESSGTVNDQPASFLIDTGASIVAMNARQAKRLGIDYEGHGKMKAAMTAGGLVKSWAVNLDSIQIGGIRINNVPAAVLQGNYPPQILLGMTFLRNVEIKQSADMMILKSRF